MLHASDPQLCRRGEIWMVDLGLNVGHEQSKIRPALVISEGPWMQRGEITTVVPITSRSRQGVPSRIPIAPPEGGLVVAGDVLADQVRTVSTQRLLRLMGMASGSTLERVGHVVRTLLGL